MNTNPNPAATYAEALERVQVMQAAEGPEVDDRCRTALLAHGRRVRRAFVLFHGFTNCPHQFAALGRMLHERGANVLIPRAPAHGLRDRMNTAQATITATSLARYADAALDCARGLGEEVVVAGLSSGGVLAAWAAQQRDDVARAVVISPAFAVGLVPPWAAPAAAQVLRWLPNRFLWWDDEQKEALATPPYGYPRFATRALSAVLRLGASVRRSARQQAPRCAAIAVVLNDNDGAVSAPPVRALIAQWRARGATVEATTLPASIGLQHDVIDPHHLGPKQAEVYALLLPLIDPS